MVFPQTRSWATSCSKKQRSDDDCTGTFAIRCKGEVKTKLSFLTQVGIRQKNGLQKTFKCIEMQVKVAQGIAADNLGGKGAVLVQRCCANCPDLGEIHQDHSRKKPIDLQAGICG